MNKLKINYWINISLGISFLICFITGLIKWPGLIKIIGVKTYMLLHFKNISIIHDISGLVMGFLVFIHLALHWKWMIFTTKHIFKRKIKNEI
jgi:hypothetical protein